MAVLLIFGRREYKNKKQAYKMLDIAIKSLNVKLVIAGKARGADTLGEDWAKERGFKFKGFPADWNKYNKGAGPIRNQQMIDEGKPTHAVAFWNGKKDDFGGTADMARRCKFYKIPVWDIE